MKLISILFLVFLICSSLSVKNTEKEKLYSKLIPLLNEIRETPLAYEKYIANLNSVAKSFSGTISNQNEINELQKNVPLIKPENLQLLSALLNNTKIGEVTIIKQINIQDKSIVNETLGAAILTEEKNIYYLIFNANSTGTVLKQTEQKTKRECERNSIWIKYCSDKVYEEERPNTPEEIEGMKKTLLSKSILSIKSKFYEEKEKNNEEKGTKKQDVDKNSDMYKIQSKKDIFLKNIESLIDNSRKLPNNYQDLVKNIKSYTDVNMNMFQKNELEDICKKYNLPNEVKTQLQSLAFASKPNMQQKIKFLNDKNKASIDELLGFAIKENNTIFFAFIRSITEGEIPNRVETIKVEKCYKKLKIIKYCHDENQVVPKPYTEDEYLTVKNALMYMSGQSLQNKLSTIKESQILLGMDGKITSSNNKYCAVIGKNGKIYVGPYNNPYENTLYTIGNEGSEANAPYSLQIKENGNIFIINKNNDKVWSSETSHKGVAPFDLVLRDDGKLDLIDSKKTVVYSMKK